MKLPRAVRRWLAIWLAIAALISALLTLAWYFNEPAPYRCNWYDVGCVHL